MNPKGRPKKTRIIEKKPQIIRFSPRGKPGRPDEIQLKIDEYEAIRHIDLCGHKQFDAAQAMQVSQQTFSRILKSGRKKLADVCINGKILMIQGTDYVFIQSKDPAKNSD